MRRQFDPAEPELMDRPQPVTRELEEDLHNLRVLNERFGSYSLVRSFLVRWIKRGDELTVLDLATGSGDIPRLVVEHARSAGAKVQVRAIDQQISTLAIARDLSADYPEIDFVRGDILADAFAPADLVLCSLALHHFSEDDAVRLLRRAAETARRFVLVADLRRGLLASLGVRLLTAFIFRAPMTKVDARLSAARAFSFSEMHELAVRAGWRTFRQRRFRFARQAIWMEKTAPA